MKWKKLVKNLIIISIFLYIFYRLYNSWGDLAQYDFHFNYTYLGLAFLVFLGFYFLEGIGYYIFTRIVHGKAPFIKVMKARYISDMGRYVPGKVWVVLGRLYFLKKYDISRLQVVMSSLLELAIMALGSILIFVISMLFWDVETGSWMYFAWAAIPIILIVIHPKVLNILINIVEKIRKKEQVRIKTNYRTMLATIGFYLFYWIVYGLGSFLTVKAITTIGIVKLPIITGIFAIAWFIGFVSFIAPGGLGVRDGLLIYFLMFLIPEPIAIIVALTSRVIHSIIEGLYALVSLKF